MMKKNVLVAVSSIVFGGIQPVLADTSSSGFQPLMIQSELPGDIEPIAAQQAVSDPKPVIYSRADQPKKIQYSLGSGYIGTYLGDSDLSGDDYFNGIYVKGQAEYRNAWGGWLEYGYNRGSDYHYEEVSAGIDRLLFDNNRVYGKLSLGVGYAWIDLSEEDLNLSNFDMSFKYITVPIAFDFGYRLTANMDLIGSVGYKWLFNKDTKLCYDESYCSSDSESGFNMEGAMYKVGFNYRF